MKEIKKRTYEEIKKEMLEKHGCIPINLAFCLDPDVDLMMRQLAGVNEELLGPCKKSEDTE